MKPVRRGLARMIRRLGCRPEYMLQGVDAYCTEDGRERRYIIRALNPACTVSVSLRTAREAYRLRSWLLIYDPDNLEVVARLPPDEWRAALYGYGGPTIHYLPRGCRVRLALTPGLEGRRVCVTVPREMYERLMERLRRAGDWETLLSELL